jgi:hypothetical protein
MTQTILKCNAIPVGKIYPVADLRTAESIEQLCELVDAGHPIANDWGFKIHLFSRFSFNHFCAVIHDNIEPDQLSSSYIHDDNILRSIFLAPLAYRNGRPLHVGGDICIFWDGEWHPKITITLSSFRRAIVETWRFADEVTG